MNIEYIRMDIYRDVIRGNRVTVKRITSSKAMISVEDPLYGNEPVFPLYVFTYLPSPLIC